MDSCRKLCQHGVSQKNLLIVQLWHYSDLLLHFSQNNFVHVKVARANMIQKDLENSVRYIRAIYTFFFQIDLNKLSTIFVLLYAILPRTQRGGGLVESARALLYITFTS